MLLYNQVVFVLLCRNELHDGSVFRSETKKKIQKSIYMCMLEIFIIPFPWTDFESKSIFILSGVKYFKSSRIASEFHMLELSTDITCLIG